MRAISLCLHDVRDIEQSTPGDVYTLRVQDFTAHLRAVEQRGASVSTITARRHWGRETPVFITFDDGAAGSYAFAAALLEAHGWRGHFFITTDWVGRNGFMNRAQILDLHKRGHVIGTHTCSHPERMSHLAPSELTREWYESCAILGEILGSPVFTGSVAGGYYSRSVAEAAASAGIQVLFTSEPTPKPLVVADCLVLGRYSIQSFTKPSVTGAIAAAECWPRWKQSLFWNAKKIVKAVAGESYVTARRELLSRLISRQKTARQ